MNNNAHLVYTMEFNLCQKYFYCCKLLLSHLHELLHSTQIHLSHTSIRIRPSLTGICMSFRILPRFVFRLPVSTFALRLQLQASTFAFEFPHSIVYIRLSLTSVRIRPSLQFAIYIIAFVLALCLQLAILFQRPHTAMTLPHSTVCSRVSLATHCYDFRIRPCMDSV